MDLKSRVFVLIAGVDRKRIVGSRCPLRLAGIERALIEPAHLSRGWVCSRVGCEWPSGLRPPAVAWCPEYTPQWFLVDIRGIFKSRDLGEVDYFFL